MVLCYRQPRLELTAWLIKKEDQLRHGLNLPLQQKATPDAKPSRM